MNKGITDPARATPSQGIEFLSSLFGTGAKYGTIVSARSALSAVLPASDGLSFGKTPLVSRILKGVFKKRPSLPKHTVIYDTNIVLEFIESWPDNNQLLLEELTLKLTTLLCLLSGQRAQSISHLHIKLQL